MEKLINKKREIIRDISIFSSGFYLGQAGYFLRGFLNASILGPAMYGLWAALNVILHFGFYAHLGVLHGMSREIPYLLGKGDKEKADRIRASAFGFCLVASILVALSVVAVSLFFKKSLGLVGMIGIVTVAILIVVQNAVNFYEMALSAVKRFSVIAIAYFLFPAMCVVLTFLLVTKWKIYGLYVVAVFGPLAILLFYYFNTRYRPDLRFDLRGLLRLIKIGFPLMTLLLFPLMLFTVDRILIFKFLGATQLGYYAFALLICRSLVYLPMIVAKVIEPRLFHKYGETEKVEDLRRYLFVPTKALSIFFPLLIGIIYFVSSFIIRHFIADYTLSLSPLFILLFGKFFILFAPTVVSFFTAMNKQYRIIYFYLIAIFLSALLDILVLTLGFGLIGVAVASGVVGFLLATSLFLYAASYYLKEWVDYFTTCARLYFPYVYILCFTLILNSIFFSNGVFLLDLLGVFLKICILIAVSMPFILHFNKEVHLFKEVASIIRSKWSGRIKT